MKQNIIRVGVSVGDINGIGPEVALKAAFQPAWPKQIRLILIGASDLLLAQCRSLRLPTPPGWAPSMGSPQSVVSVWNPDPMGTLAWKPGAVTVAASRAASAWIHAGVHACLDGTLDALVTAPICKEGFHRAGLSGSGHTELLAQLTGTRHVAMMLFGGPLRVVLATRHIPLSAVPSRITPALIREQARLTVEGLAWMGLRRRRVAVCGLNPHAGEGGDIGDEEIRIIAPAVRALQKEGLDIHGPLPGDTVFHQAAGGQYDAVLAMYHDQGLAPLKLIAFDSGVNLTLGLPLVRTSPDHGTAFALAGKDRANPASMIQAITEAARLARRTNPWKPHA